MDRRGCPLPLGTNFRAVGTKQMQGLQREQRKTIRMVEEWEEALWERLRSKVEVGIKHLRPQATSHQWLAWRQVKISVGMPEPSYPRSLLPSKVAETWEINATGSALGMARQ